MKKIFTLICSVLLTITIFAREQYVCVIAADTFNTTSYAANDGEHNIIGTDNQTYIFTTFDIMKSSKNSSIQSRKNTGSYIGFPTNLIVDSIVFNLGTSQYLNFSVKVNETNKDGIKVNDSIYYVILGSYDSLKVVNETKYTAYARYIEVYYHTNKVITSIENITMNDNTIKVYDNGQIYIRKNNVKYTITGIKVE
jgi:hypothetical protein